jgi:maleate isomerase
MDHKEAEAIFLSCTALRGAEVAQVIEDTVGIPVITSNQALLWRGLRQAGCDLKIAGFGQLLRL